MDGMYQHNVMLFPVGDKIAVVTILDREMINEYIPEEEHDKIHFVMGTTRQPIMTGGQPQMTLQMGTKMEGRVWAEKTGEPIYGMGIAGIMTAPVWFCQKIKDAFHGLM